MVQMVIYRSWRPNAYYLWNYNGGTTRRVRFVGFLIGIALLIAGIEIVPAGISGRKMRLLPSREWVFRRKL